MAIDDNTSYELTGYQVKDLASKIRAKADSNSLASVATSGLYSDLTGAPTIPTVYNGTLTIQQNGTTLGTFSANQNTNETINITGGGGGNANAVTLYPKITSPGITFAGLFSDQQFTTEVYGYDLANILETSTVLIDYGVMGNGIYKLGWGYDGDEGEHVFFAFGGDEFLQINIPSASGSGYYYLARKDYQEKLTAGSNITIASDGKTISATDTTYSDFTGATSSVAGAHGLVPAPAAGDEGKALHGDGTWKDTTAKLVEMSYGESNAWAKFIAAYNAGSIVYCRASSNANPGTGSQTRKAFMAYVNNATSPTNVEFQYVRSQSSKTDSQQCDQVFVYTLTNTSGGTWSVASRNMGPKINVSGPITKTFTTGANATITIGADTMTGATSGAAGTAGVVPAPAAGDQDKVLKGDGTFSSITSNMLSLDKLSFVIDGNVDSSQFFGGTYSQTFTVETSGNYLILDSFSSAMGRAYNASNNLTVKIDGTQVLKYRYDSVTGDQDWGTNRRTITGTQNIVALSAGSHTITTTGNLYLYDAVGSHTITAIKLADAAAQAADSTTIDRITVRKTSDSSSVGQETIAMNSVDAQVGTKLTLDSGGVKIGAGITKVLVSGNVFYNTASGKAYGWVNIRINGVDTGYETIASIANGSYGSAVFSPVILSVSENDVITFYNRESGSNIRGGHATYMTVQVVA